ncbi:retrovirus-related pol polyprotein from transposon TNT 1-94 [Tanacetum coccineum]
MKNKNKPNNRSNKRSVKLLIRYNDHIMSNLSQNRANSESNKDLDDIRVNIKDNLSDNDDLRMERVGMMTGDCNSKNGADRNTGKDVSDIDVVDNVEIGKPEESSNKLEKEVNQVFDKNMNGIEKDLRNKDSVKSYANAARDNVFHENNKPEIVLTSLNDLGEEVVVFDEELVKLGSKKWELTLCGQFVRHNMSFPMLNYHLRRMWSRYGFKEIIYNGNGSAIVSCIGKPKIMDSMTTYVCKNGLGRTEFARVLMGIKAVACDEAVTIHFIYIAINFPITVQGNPQYALQDQGIFDSGCSRHMTGNKSYLTDYQDIDGGFVAFAGSPKGGKITGKGKIRTGKLDFEDVYFVKELKFNLFSVSQMCDKKNNVLFTETECLVLSPDFKLLDESQVLLKVPRQNNMYSFDLKNVVPSGGLTCLIAKATIDESNLWHRRLGHINFKTMNKLVKGNLVRGLPLKLFENDHTCVACQKGKQHKASCKTKLVSSISHPLQMLHMDLFGPTFVRSINHKIYCLVVTDDYSRFSWVFFLATKDETSGILKTFITGIENQINHKVKIIRCDNGTEFKNNDLNQFCGMKGIKREFSVARTPQQNGVAERKNRVLVTKPHNKTPYELLLGRPPSISFMRPFGCPMTILINTLDPLGKFDGKADEGFLVGYSINSKAFRVFSSRVRKYAIFDSASPIPNDSSMQSLENTSIFDDAYDDREVGVEAGLNNLETTMNVSTIPTTKIHKDNPIDHIIGDINSATQTRRMTKISKEHAMTLVDLPKGKRAIGTKWVYRNKKDKRGIVVRNKARLVTQGYTQEEGIDYDEVLARVAWIEAIMLFFAYASFIGLIIYQMDVKSAFLYGTIEKEVNVCQPPRLIVYQMDVKSAILYGTIEEEVNVCQPPENGFRRGTTDKTLFIKKDKGDILLVHVYVDDIIFGSIKKSLCVNFEQMVHKRFQMSFMGELTFFLGLQIASTPMELNKALVKDEEADNVDVHLHRSMIGSLMYLTTSRPDITFVVCACARDLPFNLEAFSDSDDAGASLDRKSTTGAEYAAAANCCGQVLWIQNQMLNYGLKFMNTKIYIDNESTICIVKNLVLHSKTKHIEIRHHFIRDSHEKKLIQQWNAQPIVALIMERMIEMDWRCFMDEIKDMQSSMVGFGEMRQLELLRLILEETGYNWYFGFVNSS